MNTSQQLASGQFTQTQGSRPVVVTADKANCDYEYIVPRVLMILPESKSGWLAITTRVHAISRGRNNSKFSGSQQDYLVGKSGSPQIYLVVMWPRFK